MPKSSKLKTKGSRSKIRVGENISALQEAIRSTTDKFHRTKKTKDSYANHVNGAIDWVKNAIETGHLKPSMTDAFTVLSDRSAEVLLLYTAYKCSSEGENLSYSTAEGIRYACRDYWIEYVPPSELSTITR